MAVSWSQVAPFVQAAFERQGRVERADVIDLAYEANVSDEVIDAIDEIGSRVFPTVEATREFLTAQGVVTGG